MPLPLRSLWLAVAVLAAGSLLVAAPQPPPARPNILVILCDDLGYGDVGFDGQKKFATPALDRLAADGMRLTHHYCAAPVCAPSRASLLTGTHQGHTGVRDNQFDKALENNHTLASVLRRAGYATAAIGKWGLQGPGASPAAWPAYPTKRGFDFYFGYVRHNDGHFHYPKEDKREVWENDREISAGLDRCYTADLFTARAKKWIVDQQRAISPQPFFLYLAYDTPHAKLQLPPAPYPAGAGRDGGLRWLGEPGHMINAATGTPDSWVDPECADAKWPDVYRRYATDVRRIDRAVGDLRQLLADLGLADNTLIVFTSDNGPSIESYLPEKYSPEFFTSFGPFDGIKRDTWEGGIRIPLAATWPGHIAPGSTNAVPSGHWDWLPTFAELAGVAPPAHTDGVSLAPALLGRAMTRPPLVYIEYFEKGATPTFPGFEPGHAGRKRNQMQVLRSGDFLGVRYDIKSAGDDFEIYDVVRDPKEAHNLAANPAHAALQRELKARALQVRHSDPKAPRPYDSAPVPALADATQKTGQLNRAIFPGDWPWVPDLAALTPATTGRTAGIDLSAVPATAPCAVAFTGFINAADDGAYTFTVQSDGGAHLRIHDITVVDDDFARTGAPVEGTIHLAAGRHPFRLYYRHAAGTPDLRVGYEAPLAGTKPIPATVFSVTP